METKTEYDLKIDRLAQLTERQVMSMFRKGEITAADLGAACMQKRVMRAHKTVRKEKCNEG